MTEKEWPAYPVARKASELIYSRFMRGLRRDDGQPDSPHRPEIADIEGMIDAAFWASLRREEGYVPAISAAFLDPDAALEPLRFAEPIPFTPEALARLAPAVERPGIHLGVCRRNGELHVWGTAMMIPKHCFVLEVTSPGLIVIKESRGEETTKFANVAVLEGDLIKVLNEDAVNLPDCLPLLRSLLEFDATDIPGERGSRSILMQLAVSMRQHGRGGSLLVVPANSERWRESIITPIKYSVSPAFVGLSALMENRSNGIDSNWKRLMRQLVDSIAGLTAVDGATLLSDSYELLGFGAKIARRAEGARIEQVIVTEPIAGSVGEVMHPTQLGGTRHLSAAQFTHDQKDSLALVASQDGRFTIFAWSPCEGMVHAHRIESLLR